jgi:hypothetical protein
MCKLSKKVISVSLKLEFVVLIFFGFFSFILEYELFKKNVICSWFKFNFSLLDFRFLEKF